MHRTELFCLSYGWSIILKDQLYFRTLFCRTFLNFTKTKKARSLKLCQFSEQLSEHIFVKTLLDPPETRLLAVNHDLLPEILDFKQILNKFLVT